MLKVASDIPAIVAIYLRSTERALAGKKNLTFVHFRRLPRIKSHNEAVILLYLDGWQEKVVLIFTIANAHDCEKSTQAELNIRTSGEAAICLSSERITNVDLANVSDRLTAIFK